jgi:F-type H+-transporting ATPase subunit epsilon
MNLKILLPFMVFADKSNVSRIIAEGGDGSFGLLPHRLDCVTSLVPGILTYETEADGIVYVAADAGVLVKVGPDVLVSIHHAVAGTDLAQLHDAVKRQFLTLDESQRQLHTVLDKMEGALIGRFAEFQHAR